MEINFSDHSKKKLFLYFITFLLIPTSNTLEVTYPQDGCWYKSSQYDDHNDEKLKNKRTRLSILMIIYMLMK